LQKEDGKPLIDTFSLINYSGTPFHKKKIVKFSAGNNFSAALDNKGNLYTWGFGNVFFSFIQDGQLGYDLIFSESHIVNFKDKCQLTPRPVLFFKEKSANIVDVSCGKDFTLALDDQGVVYSFGSNENCQLGREYTVKIESTPKAINSISERIVSISAGWSHGMALTSEGQVYVWGNPYVDREENFPIIKHAEKISNLLNVIEIASGFHHMVALRQTSNGSEVLTWGANDYGQLGFFAERELFLKPQVVELTQFNSPPIHVT
jgi:alpha-tubulin suppressor-like RCC1 family protein